MKNGQSVVSVRIPSDLLAEIDKYVAESDIKITRSAAIVFLLARGLIEQANAREE